MMADVGDSMPDIALETPDGGTVRASDFRGRKLVVFFYPKDDTPGCTVENRDFSALRPEFEKAGTALLGVSKDPPAKHAKFAAKHGLTAPLATDADGGLSDALGCGARRASTAGCSWGCTARPTWSIPKGGSRGSGAR